MTYVHTRKERTEALLDSVEALLIVREYGTSKIVRWMVSGHTSPTADLCALLDVPYVAADVASSKQAALSALQKLLDDCRVWNLDELVCEITEDNRRELADWGPDVGNERADD